MTRVATLVVLACALAPTAAGQQIQFYHPPSGDTASIILTGDTGSVQLRASTCNGVSAYALRLFYDDARLTFLGADSVPGYNMPAPTSATGSEYVDLSASGAGYNGCTTLLANVHFRLDSAATLGSLLSVRVTNLTNFSGTDVTAAATSLLGQICEAGVIWGDADSTRTITSHDALIFLSYAVGLPAPSFDLATGDIDNDGAVTTRDALYVLSKAIGLSASRTGRPIPGHCAPLMAAPSDMAFYSNSTVWRIAQGDTVPVNLGVAPYVNAAPAWTPDGSRILFEYFVSGRGTDFATITPDGTTLDTILVTTSYDYAPSVSPDGTMIAFVSAGGTSGQAVWVMDTSGANQRRLTDTVYVRGASSLAWTPDGSAIVFTGYNLNGCCSDKLWAVQPADSVLREVFTNSVSFSPANPTVSPAGDSVAFRGTSNAIYVAAMSGDTAASRQVRLEYGMDWPQWVSAGIAFRWTATYPYGFYLRRSDGRILRLARGVGSSYGYLRLRTP